MDHTQPLIQEYWNRPEVQNRLTNQSGRRAAVLVAALGLLALAGAFHQLGRLSDDGPSVALTGVHPMLAPSPHFSYHSSLFLNDSAPNGTFPPGETIRVVYAIQVAGSPEGAVGAKVGIPPSLVQFPAASSAIRLFPSYTEATIGPNGSAYATPGATTHLSDSVSFNSTGNAFLSTYGVAVMASWPYGHYTVQFQWRWVLTAENGSSITGPWSNTTSVNPAILTKFATPPPTTWVKGAPYTLCLTGSLSGRSFSVQVSMANGVQQFDDGVISVSSSAAEPFCWNSTLPSNVLPQAAFIHLWELSNVSYLLYVIQVQVVNGTGSPVQGKVEAATLGWLPFAVGGGAVVVVAFVLAFLLLFTPRRSIRGRAPSLAGDAGAPTQAPTPSALAVRPRLPPVTVARRSVYRPKPANRYEQARWQETENPLSQEGPAPAITRGRPATVPGSIQLWSEGRQADDRWPRALDSRNPNRVSTGIPRLDDLLRGGLSPNAHVLLIGDPFLGKEVALYAFIAEGLRQGEPAIIVTGTRGPEEVRLQITDVLPTFEMYERDGLVQWIDISGPSGVARAPSHVQGAAVVNGSDDYPGILKALELAMTGTNRDLPRRVRVAFLGFGAAIAQGREGAGFAFLQSFVGVLKRRPAVAMYTVEPGALAESELERVLPRMDGAIRFKRQNNRTMLSVVGIGEVATHEWVEYRATNRSLVVGSFSLERIR